MTDILGTALLDYYNDNYTEDIITESTISEADEMPIPYLFRDFKDMPKIEQKALQLAKGKTLDVGCGSGNHALYLQSNGIEIDAIDISKGAIEVSKLRGIKNATLQNLFDITKQYDTILLLMNGIGICGKLKQLDLFLIHLKSILKPNGQILIDSSDIKYMFDTDEDGGIWINTNDYYGEVEFTMTYKGETSDSFDWLYLDFETLKMTCTENGMDCKLVQEGENFDFLVQLTLS